MRKRFKLECIDWSSQHVRFNLFDPSGANCGTITIQTEDWAEFIAFNWEGDVFWNGKMPGEEIEKGKE